jgi:hypothetical protein
VGARSNAVAVIKAIWNYVELLQEHAHSVGFVRPTGAVNVALASGAGAWALSAGFTTIIAAGSIPSRYDLHWYDLDGPSANATYEIVLYGTVGAQ